MSEHIVVAVGKVQAAEMAIAIDADVTDLERVRPDIAD